MEFNDILKEGVVPKDEAVIKAIKADGNPPVMIFGMTADVGERIWRKLADNRIEVDFVLQEDDVPNKAFETRTVCDLPRTSIKYVDGYYRRKFYVIVGYVAGYAIARKIRRRFLKARAVCYLSEIFDMEIIRPEFVRANREALESLYNNLSDRLSKKSLLAYLRSKIEQDMKYLPPVFERTQYFPKGLFKLTDNESFVDCGAYTGDTIADFLTATDGKYRRIWAVEPDKENFRELQYYVERNHLNDVEVINKGVYSAAGQVQFKSEGSMLSMIDENADNSIEVDTIDHITGGEEVTYIKFDVEGAELEALKGAEQTIRRYRPLLAVSVYHRERDLIDIPAYINSISPDYRFYFRAHKKLAIDAILYCVKTVKNEK
jgi:FkbM family methyltransferase